jgi:LPXTG-site transpeptidase (sortase) family protein
MLAVGLVLLGGAGAYYLYTARAASNFDQFIVPPTRDAAQALPPQPTKQAPGSQPIGRPSPAWQPLYPGSVIPARQWADPRGTLDLDNPQLDGFTPLSPENRPSIVGAESRAQRIKIPALDIDSPIEELGILDLGDSSAYETPKNTVGHIPESPNAGSHGNSWYFGHLESPIQGEGNVFARLPLVPQLLRDGEDVYVILVSESQEYLYQVSQTDLISQDDISLYQAGDARITLVTCYPRLKYDQRLLVTAMLIGFRDATPV